ncbi:unnamed protein product [Mycena citricolor]|uniref:Uncharacterized protein n=1 Tax=Mycena citricolor TaxID=2018698 RepID=A0AAD2HR15_9AGAR|nr:unnamed protein product [Mycena citricolor]
MNQSPMEAFACLFFFLHDLSPSNVNALIDSYMPTSPNDSDKESARPTSSDDEVPSLISIGLWPLLHNEDSPPLYSNENYTGSNKDLDMLHV